MNNNISCRLRKVINLAPVFILFFLGMWLVVLRPLGPHLALVPGNLGDPRFINYLLEHFFRWSAGLTGDYWNAPFFFPFPQTIAFADNLLGSAPFYALFRLTGFERESAFQGWIILGYILNYAAAGYVLWRIKLKPLAAGVGAFFFAFGLPMLAQESHAQLLYRFCIPLVCFFLWRFYQAPRLRILILLGTCLVWQFYQTIYIGVFLLLLLTVLILLLPFFVPEQTCWRRFAIWPRCLIKAWSQVCLSERILALMAAAVLSLGLLTLFLPYYQVSLIYGFSRGWEEVSTMLPRWQSYLLADSSQLWQSTASIFTNLPMRWEHNLFPGISIVLVVLVGIAWRFRTENRRLAWLHFGAALLLVILTLEVDGFSLYRLVWQLPGLNSLRAITRIMLVLMWPLSFFAAWAIDGFLQFFTKRRRWMQSLACVVAVLLVVESAFFNHLTHNKAAAQARLATLRQQIPVTVPANPILLVVLNRKTDFWATEIDAMLLAQELGWPTLNGYSGNSPPGYALTFSCKQLPKDIIYYLDFNKIISPTYYLDMINRIVPIGFNDCEPVWWTKKPLISSSAGPFSEEIFSGLALKVLSLKTGAALTTAQVEISNNSSLPIPALSLTKNPFRLSWRFIGAEDQKPWSTFDTRQDLDFDIPAHNTTQVTIILTPPDQVGHYLLEVTALQEFVAWFYDLGTPIAVSSQQLIVDEQGKVLITP